MSWPHQYDAIYQKNTSRKLHYVQPNFFSRKLHANSLLTYYLPILIICQQECTFGANKMQHFSLLRKEKKLVRQFTVVVNCQHEKWNFSIITSWQIEEFFWWWQDERFSWKLDILYNISERRVCNWIVT